ncbi:transposable element Tcb2 transposase [Trichonephila clavipes]|nr:transposable element Tcb2 transposase [Trichonephila clavipes]
MANNQSVRRHLDAFNRGRIIGKLEEGRSVTSVAAEFGIAHSIVSRLWRQFQTTGTAIRGFSSGRSRGITPADDRGAMGLQFLFMADNAPCHRTVAAEQLLESENIERMDWPALSPDLNPIEHVWEFLGRRLAARTLPPVTIRELRLALQDEWAAMPQQLIDTLILSMDRRCETCLAVRGDHIP